MICFSNQCIALAIAIKCKREIPALSMNWLCIMRLANKSHVPFLTSMEDMRKCLWCTIEEECVSSEKRLE